MKVEYSNRAAADLRKASADSLAFGDAVAIALETRIHRIIAGIAEHPKAAQRVIERQGMHVVPPVRFPYKIFYRVLEDPVRILRIRHTSRRSWIMDQG